MDTEELQADTTPVRLIDRVQGAPAFTALFNGNEKIIRKKAGADELMLPKYVAIWFLQHDRDKVWTITRDAEGKSVPGPFVHRFALLEPDEDVLAKCGTDILDADPIELDPSAVEQWDTSKSPIPRKGVTYTTLGPRELAEVRAYQRERQAGAATFSNAG